MDIGLLQFVKPYVTFILKPYNSQLDSSGYGSLQ
jgi:hypothetical protein